MKKFLTSKKGIVLLVTAIAAIVAAVGAYAYFTSTGHGSTTASVGQATNWNVAADSLAPTIGDPSTYLYPGQGSIESTGTVTNVGDPNQKLHKLVATIDAPTGMAALLADSDQVACSAADFALSKTTAGSGWVIAADGLSATQTINQDLLPTGTYDWSGLSVSMRDLNQNQDNCQSATVNLSFDAS
jgi:hypothetical protein